jgi:hypothetical protein
LSELTKEQIEGAIIVMKKLNKSSPPQAAGH